MSRFKGWKISDLAGLEVVGEDLPKNQQKHRETDRETKKNGTFPSLVNGNKLMSGSPIADIELKVIPIFMKKIKATDYVGMISSALNILGVDHVREYKFLEDRRFKFDIAIPEKKIAIEFEGGIFSGSGGRHTRGKGYANDAKKYNLAAMHGWKLLRYTSADVQNLNWEFKAAEEIRKLIKTSEEI